MRMDNKLRMMLHAGSFTFSSHFRFVGARDSTLKIPAGGHRG